MFPCHEQFPDAKLLFGLVKMHFMQLNAFLSIWYVSVYLTNKHKQSKIRGRYSFPLIKRINPIDCVYRSLCKWNSVYYIWHSWINADEFAL